MFASNGTIEIAVITVSLYSLQVYVDHIRKCNYISFLWDCYDACACSSVMMSLNPFFHQPFFIQRLLLFEQCNKYEYLPFWPLLIMMPLLLWSLINFSLWFWTARLKPDRL